MVGGISTVQQATPKIQQLVDSVGFMFNFVIDKFGANSLVKLVFIRKF